MGTSFSARNNYYDTLQQIKLSSQLQQQQAWQNALNNTVVIGTTTSTNWQTYAPNMPITISNGAIGVAIEEPKKKQRDVNCESILHQIDGLLGTIRRMKLA